MKLIQFFFFTYSLNQINGDNTINDIINNNDTNRSAMKYIDEKYRSFESITDIPPCEDNKEFFRIVTPTMQRIRKTCAWVKRDKTQWRCSNYEHVLENCPETCGLCSPSLPTEGSTFSSKRWCQNSDKKFVIKSKTWFNDGERSCQWASTRLSRCDIAEVADHCPLLCDTCTCKDKEGRFRMSNGRMRTCLWLKTKKNRLKRCSFDPEVIMHCPLACGECTEETFVGTSQKLSNSSSSPSSKPSNFHSSVPSSKPTWRPTNTPTKQPTRKPSNSPSMNPSVEASGIPSSQHSIMPSLQPSDIVSSNPSHTPSSNPSDSPTVKPSQNPTDTPSISPTSEPSDSPTLQPTNRPSQFPTFQPSSRPSTTPSKDPSSSPSANPSAKPSVQPSITPTSTPSLHPSVRPSLHRSNVPSMQPSTQPTDLPSSKPTMPPTMMPSSNPSRKPSVMPSRQPTSEPSEKPSDMPSMVPSGVPTKTPSVEPSSKPSTVPSISPSSTPTAEPSLQPTSVPSYVPSTTPSQHPSSKPTTKPSTIPTLVPSQIPSKAPSATPTTHPSRIPTTVPSIAPSSTPSAPPSSMPSATPSNEPSTLPSSNPSDHPTNIPSTVPTNSPSQHPSSHPSSKPSGLPTDHPTNIPSTVPTNSPSQHPSSHPSSKPSGLPTDHPSYSPSSVPSLDGSAAPTPVFYDMKVGGFHSSAITSDGKLILWGRNRYGAIGDGLTTDRLTPVQIDIGTDVSPKQVALGDEHSCVITNNNDEMKCFGHNNRGQIGDGTTSNRLTPTAVNFGSNQYATQIGAGVQHTCAILNDDSLKCWGGNAYGQVGDGTSFNHFTPQPVNFGSDVQVKDLSVGGYHTCLITIDNVLMCWGLNTNGQLGDGTRSTRRTPKVISLDVDEYAVEIGTSNFHTCVITNLEKLKCWGANYSGQIGDGTKILRTTPTTVDLGLDVVPTQVALGEYHSCIISNDGTLKCWGNNYYGQLGDGTRTHRLTPKTISLGTNLYAVKVSAGNSHTCAVSNDGMLRCWGRNQYGEVGVGDKLLYNHTREVYQLV